MNMNVFVGRFIQDKEKNKELWKKRNKKRYGE